MPRPDELTPLRRFLEQAIMWIILAGTVGMAVLVDRGMNRLGEQRSIGGVVLRLPANWRPTEDDGEGRIELRERGERLFARTVMVRPLSGGFTLESLISTARIVQQQQVQLPDGLAAKISVRRRVARDEELGRSLPLLEVMAVVSASRITPIVITIQQVNTGSPRDVELNVELMRRILSTVRRAQRE